MKSIYRIFTAFPLLFTLGASLHSAETKISDLQPFLHEGEVESFTYLNIEQDFERLSEIMDYFFQKVAANEPSLQQYPVEFGKIFSIFGLNDLAALGSSVQVNPIYGYESRSVLKFKTEPSGIFSLYQTSNQPLSSVGDAPADADFSAEILLDGESAIAFAQSTAVAVMGPVGEMLLQQQLNRPLVPEKLTVRDLILALGNRISITLKSTPSTDPATPGIDAVFKINEIAPLITELKDTLLQLGFVIQENKKGLYLVNESTEEEAGMPITILADNASGSAYFATSPDVLEWVLTPTKSLKETEHWLKWSEGLPMEGIALAYTSESYALNQIESLKQLMPETSRFRSLFLEAISLVENQASASIGYAGALPDGFNFIGRTETSWKEYFTGAILAGGLLGYATYEESFSGKIGGMEKPSGVDPIEEAVIDNLRMIAISAENYLGETGNNSVTYPELKTWDPKIAAISPVADESYSHILIQASTESIYAILPTGEIVEYILP